MFEIRSIFLSAIGAGLITMSATAAYADMPLFNATCPGNIEVHADEGGPVYFNGSEAKLHRSNANYYEAVHGPVTVSISVNPDGSVTVSYTRRGGGNGMCQVLAGKQQRTQKQLPTLAIDQGAMPRFCAGEASARFGVRPTEITTNIAFKSGARYVVQGHFEGDGGTTFFNCYFDGQGNFVEVH